VIELAEIFRRYGPQYRAKYGDKMLPSHRQVMRAIERCRTPALGGHVYYCPECSEVEYQYHSCRNRHCPKCQNAKGQQWLEQQQAMLLPVTYFMLTATLPSELRPMARSHQKLIYDLLLRTSAAAVQKLAQDPRFVGGQIGMVGVLHTWGRNLSYHPHVHYLIPAVGVAADGQAQPSNSKNFLVPVKALSRIIRAKFCDALRQTDCYALVPATVWEQEWVVHCQPVGDGVRALKYLAPYIFRVAISNRRILKLEDGKVTFRYRTSDTGTLKTCMLPVEEFIRRFLQHVLPKGFVKVRYYGFFSSGLRPRLAALRQQLGSEDTDIDSQTTDHPEDVPSSSSVLYCPACGCLMQRRRIARPKERCPP
jgi:hypothetical protein